jgi:hypothetical protein
MKGRAHFLKGTEEKPRKHSLTVLGVSVKIRLRYPQTQIEALTTESTFCTSEKST